MTSSNWTVVTPTSPSQVLTTSSVIFLAGPIQGARDWQSEAIGYLGVEIDRAHEVYENVPHIYIANPRREEKFGNDDREYLSQVRWERGHLDVARQNGVIMFWLATESYHHCERSYAQTTRFELGETIGRWAKSQMTGSIVIGRESGFSGARYIDHVVDDYSGLGSVCDDLRKTCARAVHRLSGVRW